MLGDTPTIFALSTARGRGGLAVVRVSGSRARFCLTHLTGKSPEPRVATLATITTPESDEVIDRGLVLWFPAPASVTGEDVAEFHVHGGASVVTGLLEALGTFAGSRLAEPGEFTKRAFENGKMDLSAAEAVADLIDAETSAQRRQALRQVGGMFARLTEDWSARLTRSLAYVEAAIDFPEEEIPSDLLSPARAEAQKIAAEITVHLTDERRGEILRSGLSVALVGPPNSGKSSILNALSGRDAAIVSSIAGTTRDIIEVHLDLAGYAVILADTAGIREGADEIEAEGIKRAKARAALADLTLLILDAGSEARPEEFVFETEKPTLLVWNKIDRAPCPEVGIGVSATTGEGLDRLLAALTAQAEAILSGPVPVITRQRHRMALQDCVEALHRAAVTSESGLMAEDLRLALRSAGRITGRVDVEDLLDIVFRDFCIGK